MLTVALVPEPLMKRIGEKRYIFDGFANFPKFLQKEFEVPLGKWRIEKVKRAGTGLKILKDKVQIWGEESVCYATLIQILKQFQKKLPEIEIEESFEFKFRAYHLDIARGGVPTVEEMKRILKLLFLLKYTHFGIYFEDLFPWTDSEIGRFRGRYTKEELKKIIDYGEKLGVDVFPSLELTGHMEHILAIPKYRKFSEWHNYSEGCLDLSNERAKKFALELLEEVLDFFPSSYAHIGGDETWALGRGKSLNKTWNFRGPELYENHYAQMINAVISHSKKAIMWGDMLTGMYLNGSEKLKWQSVLRSDIWDKVVIANWDYSPKEEEKFEKEIESFGDKRKEKQLACPGFSNWNTYYPNFEDALKNIRNFLKAARKKKLPGFLVTSWGDDGAECLFSFLNPLLLATMEIAEGNGKWEEKWLAISGENENVLHVRKVLGKSNLLTSVKRALFFELNPYYKFETETQRMKTLWEDALNESKDVPLPRDLEFVRTLLKISLKKIANDVKSSDFTELAKAYSQLWLAERKREGLEKIVAKFWSLAGIVGI